MSAFSSRSFRTAVPVGASRISRLLTAGLTLALACASSAPAQAQQWRQVWSDEFNGAAGSEPNRATWVNELGTGFGTGELEYATDSRENSYHDGNGNMVIEVRYDPASNRYTAARLITAGKYATPTYCRIEARIKNPYAKGIGAAFWALGNNSVTSNVPWPWCGELDIMEITSKLPGHNGGTVHGGQTDGGTNYSYGGCWSVIDLPGSQKFSDDYHVFGTNLAPYRVTFDLDGKTYGDINLANLGTTDIWPLNQPLYFILSVGVGSGNSDQPDGTGFPTRLYADYVRVYELASGAPSAPSNLGAVSNNSNAATLSWNASTAPDVTYNVYASTSPNFTANLDTLVIQNVKGTTYTHTGLNPDTTYYYKVVASNFGGESTALNAQVKTQVAGHSAGVKLTAGGYSVGDFIGGKFVLGGNTNYHPYQAIDLSQVTNPAPLQVYQTERWGSAAWTIGSLTPQASYQVVLHFVEMAHSGAGQRLFNVSINSATALSNFDIFAAAGGQNKAITKTFVTKANENGLIELQTLYGYSNDPAVDLNPTIAGIEILPTANTASPLGIAPGNATYLAVNSGAGAVGNFQADAFFNSGVAATTTNTINTSGVANAAPMGVYQSQRYVPFTYALNGLQANATYNVRLHFAETYFTAPGQRLFNVDLNGKNVISKLDIFAEAGQNKALVKNVTANSDMYGQMLLQFIYAGADQPTINGVECTQIAGPVVAPRNLAAPSPANSGSLSWTPSTTAGVTYSVYRSTTTGVLPSAYTQIATGLTNASYVDSAVASGATYYYVVAANTSQNQSTPSNQVAVNINGTSAVQPPSNLKGTYSAPSVQLTWSASPTSNVTYSILRSTPGIPSAAIIKTGLTTLSYVDTPVSANTTYDYVVTANAAQGSASASVTVNTGKVDPALVAAINVGGAATGSFTADAGFSGGGTAITTNTISTTGVTNAAPAAVYQSERAGNFTYTLSNLVAGNPFTVRLHFAEFYFNQVGQRTFNVAINGNPVLSNFDIVQAAGGANKANVQSFNATANASGQIVLQFTSAGHDQPKLSGIEVVGANVVPPVTTVGVNAGGGASGSFGADAYFTGGGAATTTNTISTSGVTNAAPASVYQSERAGECTYTIPVTAGNHTVRLHFAEFYFNQAGQRTFNVSINGKSVLSNFDIVATAGGANKANVQEFTASANANNQIVVQFTNAGHDQAKVSGIEIQ